MRPLFVKCLVTGVSVACSQQATDGLAHLHGRHIIRYPILPGWVEHSRYLVRGERRADGCMYPATSLSGIEWVVESDREMCVQLRARGSVPDRQPQIIVPPPHAQSS